MKKCTAQFLTDLLTGWRSYW